MNKISVLGGGSWGTTLANLLAAKDLNVSIWARDPKIFVKKKNTHINKKYLPKYTLSSKLKIQQDVPFHVVIEECMFKLRYYIAPKINDDEDEREDFGEFEDDTYENLENKVL